MASKPKTTNTPTKGTGATEKPAAGPKSFSTTYVFKSEGKSLWIYQSQAVAGGDGKVVSGVNQIYLRKDEYAEKPKGNIKVTYTIA